VDKEKTLKQITDRSKNTMVGNMGIELTDIGQQFICGKMPVDHRTKTPFGVLHGGSSVALAETLGSIIGGFQVDGETQTVVGIDINASHLKSVSDGWVYGKAEAVRIGRKIQVWDINIKDENQKMVCKSRLTLAVINKR
jgi:1,4-dihydroxy-2-naphthoyl-CoA hydrolase